MEMGFMIYVFYLKEKEKGGGKEIHPFDRQLSPVCWQAASLDYSVGRLVQGHQ